jgi:hypothetical protein
LWHVKALSLAQIDDIELLQNAWLHFCHLAVMFFFPQLSPNFSPQIQIISQTPSNASQTPQIFMLSLHHRRHVLHGWNFASVVLMPIQHGDCTWKFEEVWEIFENRGKKWQNCGGETLIHLEVEPLQVLARVGVLAQL